MLSISATSLHLPNPGERKPLEPLRASPARGRDAGAGSRMGRLRWPAWLLLGALVLLQGGRAGTSSHSLRYFYTAVSASSQGLPRFVAVGYVDDQLIEHYDSDTRRVTPRVPWMAKAGEEHPWYWDRNTQASKGWEATFRADLETLRHHYHRSAGIHTWQSLYGCELREDGTSKGYLKFGYDGRDFLTFDKETLTWRAAVVPAQRTKREWDAESGNNEYRKAYLEEICIEWLRKYLGYGRESLQRKVPPEVKVTHKAIHDGLETLLCRAHAFYPQVIDATWRRDGEVRQGDTFRGVVSPNADGTYYTWLSINIDPQERSRFRCHVEHDGLGKPLDVAVEEAVPVWLVAVGVVLLGVLLVLAVAGVFLYLKQRPKESVYETDSGPFPLEILDVEEQQPTG